MDSTTDNALMLKVKKGDLDKLGLLFERYHRRLYHFFYRMNRRRDVSEDLVQEVFERILKYRSTYTTDGQFSTWLFQIARNLHIDQYRKQEKEPVIDNMEDMQQLADTANNESEQANTENLKLLQTAINRLDPTKKETLLLSRFQGFKYKEIADIMDCTEAVVKVRVYRAIRELKIVMNELKEA